MNIFARLTNQSLKKNRTRTLVTIIGIILSTAMICAVTTFTSSFLHFLLDNSIYNNGSWHGHLCSADKKTSEALAGDERISDVLYLQQLGYAQLEDSKNPYKPYLYILSAQRNPSDMLAVHITSGRFPESAREILLPEHLRTNGGIRYELGQTISLPMGHRELDGEILTQQNPAYIFEQAQEIPSGESFVLRETRTYEVVGFYERADYELEPYSAPGYLAFTLTQGPADKTALTDVYFKTTNPQDTYDLQLKSGLRIRCNTDVLAFQGAFLYKTFGYAMNGLIAIVVGLILFGAVALIYNAFSISVSERTKQFGLLSSMGATKRQISGMIRREALTVSAIGIPLGIAAGIGGIGITLLCIGDRFTQIMSGGGYAIPLRLYVSPASVIFAAVIALVTVVISAWVPAMRARRVTAMEAIRETRDVRPRPRDTKTSKLTWHLFGLPGVLGSRYYKRSRKKYRATVLSLFMSIVLFISSSAVTDYVVTAVEHTSTATGYDIGMHGRLDDLKPEVLFREALNTEGITDGALLSSSYIDSQVSPDILTDQWLEFQNEGRTEETVFFPITVTFVDDDSFLQMVRENRLDPELFLDPEHPRGIALDGSTVFNYEAQRFEILHIFQKDTMQIVSTFQKVMDGYTYQGETKDAKGNILSVYEAEDGTRLLLPPEEAFGTTTLDVAAVIENLPYFCDSRNYAEILYPMSQRKHLSREDFVMDNGLFTCRMRSSNHKESTKALKTMLTDKSLQGSIHVNDYAEDYEGQRNLIAILRVFTTGFIVLISLIAATNVFNTVTTNMNLRRREFAMLRSVGMTKKGFARMLGYECLLYGSRALLWGLPVSFLMTVMIWKTVAGLMRLRMFLPWKAVGISVISVFTLVFATMLYAMHRLSRENLIDTLKNDNI